MIKREASILKPILVTHDLENPTAKYLYENNIASWTEQHFRKDLEILLNCEAVVFDCSTIIFFIILYSKKLKRLYISDVLLDAYNGTPLSIGHMNINEIIGDKIELIIINLPNYPKYGEFYQSESLYKYMIEYNPNIIINK